ncbi:MAG: pyridoxal phosphate-dependent aminotransferase [Pseudomonadota bacterium]|nr:pyridoxal phosphate-dependent aminotransferase [Pseudomonadota bacterium]
MKLYTDLINSLSAEVPFVGPEAQERSLGMVFKARLGANESIFGPSEKSITAMQKATAFDVWKYGDPENYELREAIAKRMNVNRVNIVIGEGIDALLGYLVRLIVEPGVKVITSLGAYTTFNYHVKGYGGELIFIPYQKDHEDLEALVDAAAKHRAKLIYVANPDNPMGTANSAKRIEEIIKRIPEDCILCLDEAYADFAPKHMVPEINVENPQVLRFRTFSKAYGLAGARIGFAIGASDVIKNFDKIRNHFGVNRIAQTGALAALNDEEYLNIVKYRVNEAKGQIEKIATENNLSTIESFTNFVAVDCGREGQYATKILQNLIKREVFVRMPSVAPLNRCIRITVGEVTDMTYLADQLPKVLKETI